MSCDKNSPSTEYNYTGEIHYYSNPGNGTIDSSISLLTVNVKTIKDSIIFTSSDNSLDISFKQNKEGVYEYRPLGNRESKKYKFSGDSLYADYGYSNPSWTVDWANFAGLKQ